MRNSNYEYIMAKGIEKPDVFFLLMGMVTLILTLCGALRGTYETAIVFAPTVLIGWVPVIMERKSKKRIKFLFATAIIWTLALLATIFRTFVI